MTSPGYVAEVAKRGFGEGTNESYDKTRMSYQPEVIAHLRECITTPEPWTIVEIGSGTGIFTRALLTHPSFSNAVKELKAVEPSEGMRNFFVKSTVEKDPEGRISVMEGTFDRTGVEDGVADMIVIAQAFHWCPQSMHEVVAKEFARVLKPGGIVAMIWNRQALASPAWFLQVYDFISNYAASDTMSSHTGEWKGFFQTPTYSQFFGPLVLNENWSYTTCGTKEDWIARTMTVSAVAVQSDETKAEIVDGLRTILEKGDERRWVDEEKGVFECPYRTVLAVARLRTTESS